MNLINWNELAEILTKVRQGCIHVYKSHNIVCKDELVIHNTMFIHIIYPSDDAYRIVNVLLSTNSSTLHYYVNDERTQNSNFHYCSKTKGTTYGTLYHNLMLKFLTTGSVFVNTRIVKQRGESESKASFQRF